VLGSGQPVRNRSSVISRKIFAGNLSFDLTRDDLVELFSTVGPVADITLPVDRMSGRLRGFAFVEFENDEDAAKAIETLNGRDLAGRELRLDEARERAPRPPRDPGGGGGGGGFDPGGGGRPFKAKGSRRGIRGRKRGF